MHKKLQKHFCDILVNYAIPDENSKDKIANVFLFHLQALLHENLTEDELYYSFLSCIDVFLKYSNDTTYLDLILKINDHYDWHTTTKTWGKYCYIFDFVHETLAVKKKNNNKIHKDSSENIRLNADYIQKIIPGSDYLHKVAVALELIKVCEQYDKYLYQDISEGKQSLQETELIEAQNQLKLRQLAESAIKTATVNIKGVE